MPAVRSMRYARRGTSLAELLVAMVLFGIIGGGIADVVARQWRMHAMLDARRDVRAQLAAAADAIRPSLRMAAVGGDSLAPNDLVTLTDTLIEVRATIGASVVCGIPDPSTLELPPPSTSAPSITWWLSSPQPGDVVLVHDDVTSGAPWRTRTIASVGSSITACTSSPLVRASEAALSRVLLHVAPALPASIVVGAPLRLTRRIRWVHYRASDGRWYLGEREFDGTTWSVTQPVAGPLRPTGSRSGMFVTARDSTGAIVPPSLVASRRVTRIDVVLRADMPVANGARGKTTIDTLAFTIAPRNGG